jgi:hypothetical protein
MHKKSFIFGFGTALLLLSMLLYFAYSIQINIYRNDADRRVEEAQTAAGSSAEAISRARELGMAFPIEMECEICEIRRRVEGE